MSTGRMIIGVIFIIIGISALTGLDIFRYLFPLLIIWLGWTIITGKKWPGNFEKTNKLSTNTINEVLIFSATKRNVESVDFTGGNVVVIFGGAELDLTKVKTVTKEINFELVTIFGETKIRVPANWSINSEVAAILGGFDNETKVSGDKKIQVKIGGAAVLGNIQITN